MIEEEVNIPKLNLTASERNYLQHRRCFTLCVKEFNEPTLAEAEKVCVKNCLHKYRDAEKFMVDKIHRTMQNLIRSDMSLMNTYKEQQEAKQSNLG